MSHTANDFDGKSAEHRQAIPAMPNDHGVPRPVLDPSVAAYADTRIRLAEQARDEALLQASQLQKRLDAAEERLDEVRSSRDQVRTNVGRIDRLLANVLIERNDLRDQVETLRRVAPKDAQPPARLPVHYSDLIASRLFEVIGSYPVEALGIVSEGEPGLRELNAFALGVEWSNDNEVSTKGVRLLLVEIANVRQALLNDAQKAAPAAAPASAPSVEYLVEDLLVRWCPCPKHTRKREQKGNPS